MVDLQIKPVFTPVEPTSFFELQRETDLNNLVFSMVKKS